MLTVGCGGGGSDDGAAGNGGAPGGPLYAVTTEVNTGSDYQSYLVLTDSLTADQSLDLADALELPGRARGVGPAEGGVVFTSGDEAPTLTRYDLQPDGTLRKGKTVSFSNEGVTSVTEYQSQFYFISTTKAYYFDGTTGQVIIWNPETMLVTDTIDLTSLVEQDRLLIFSQSPPMLIGQELFYPAGWLSADRMSVPTESAMVIVNLDNDEATIVRDTRCGWARDGVRASDGYIYLATETYAAAVYHLDSNNAGAPCMIRFDPTTKAYDAGFSIELDSVIDPSNAGGVAGMLIPAGPDAAYLRVLDPDLVQGPPVPILVSVGASWGWWKVTLGDTPSATEVSALPVSGGRTTPLDAGDLLVAPEYGGDPVQTFLRPLTDDGLGEANTRVEGQVFSVTKLR